MLVEERVVDEAVRGIEQLPVISDESSSMSWFAVRQPGIVRYLAARCGEDSDAMAVALYTACAIEQAFHTTRGLAPPRVLGSLLERAEEAFLSEATSSGRPGLAERQPALAQLIARVVEAPPVPLDDFEATRVGVALAAVVYALDETAFGRPVP